ncbi:hypothetical protein [Micromonospora siamensis]|uniref:SRCR domain-containing protein n=1 Tax=Micromonospora siamensis TaxID=299152 RepID=A0A1C5IIA1_9ACTN|nr:hypothetical protein GA0074704_3392 [Micromonospora siamensis]
MCGRKIEPTLREHTGLVAGDPEDRFTQFEGQTLRADFVRSLCSHPIPDVDRVTLNKVRIEGRLDLSRQHLKHGLRFTDCHFADDVDLSWANCDELIEFVDCRMTGLHADEIVATKGISALKCHLIRTSFAGAQIKEDLRLSETSLEHRPGRTAFNGPAMVVEGSVRLDGAKVSGEVLLASSHVGKDLDLRSARFDNGSGLALDATSVTVGGELRGDRDFRATGEVRLCWARATTVSFRRARLENPDGVALRADSLRAELGCYLDQGLRAEGTVRLVGAQIDGEVSCTASTFTSRCGAAIEAERLAAKDVYLDRGFHADGGVRLIGAVLTRQLTCTSGRFDNPAGVALDLTGLNCSGSAYLDRDPQCAHGFHADGQVRMCGAGIDEALVCTDGLFAHQGDVALDADGLTTTGDVRLDGTFRAIGRVRLSRATVGRQLVCSAGSFDSTESPALDLTGLVGRGDVLLNAGFRATGEVRLRDATVDRDVDLSDGHLEVSGTTALDAVNLHVGGTFTLRLAEPPSGLVDVRFATVQRLKDSRSSWPVAGTAMEGFTYQNVEDGISTDERLDILRHTTKFSLQPYQQLSRVYREAGRDKDERKVAIAGRVDYRKRDDQKWPARTWNRFLRHTVGYGYELWRPFVIALALIVLNFPIYHTAEHARLMEPVGGRTEQAHHDEMHCPGDFPCFNPLAYSVQLFIPVANLQEVDKWVPDATKGRWGTFLLGWTWLMVIIGWLLAVALGAGINEAIQRK